MPVQTDSLDLGRARGRGVLRLEPDFGLGGGETLNPKPCGGAGGGLGAVADWGWGFECGWVCNSRFRGFSASSDKQFLFIFFFEGLGFRD